MAYLLRKIVDSVTWFGYYRRRHWASQTGLWRDFTGWGIALFIALVAGCGTAAPSPVLTPAPPTVRPTHATQPTEPIIVATTIPWDGVVHISVGEDFFYPAEVTIRVGTSVEWSHGGIRAHNITSVNGAWDSVFFDVGSRYRMGFNTPGVYEYLCTFHSGMGGTIRVFH